MEFRDRYRFLRRSAAALAQGMVIAPVLPLLCIIFRYPSTPGPALTGSGKAAGSMADSGGIAPKLSLDGDIHCRVCNGIIPSRSDKPGATGPLRLDRQFPVRP